MMLESRGGTVRLKFLFLALNPVYCNTLQIHVLVYSLNKYKYEASMTGESPQNLDKSRI